MLSQAICGPIAERMQNAPTKRFSARQKRQAGIESNIPVENFDSFKKKQRSQLRVKAH